MAGWSIDIAAEWRERQEEDTVVIYHPDGVGALQVNAFTAEDDIKPADLDQLADTAGLSGAEFQAVECGAFAGKACELKEGEELWRFWFLAYGDCALAIAYNCHIDDRNSEAKTIQAMLDSLAPGEAAA